MFGKEILMSKFVISDTPGAAVNARSVVNFKVSMLSEIESSTGRDLINFKTVSTSQIKEYLGKGSLWLNTRDMSAQARRCLTTDILSIGS